MDKFPIQKEFEELKSVFADTNRIDERIDMLSSFSLQLTEMSIGSSKGVAQEEIVINVSSPFPSYPITIDKKLMLEAVEKQIAIEEKKYHLIKDKIKNKLKELANS